MKVVRSLILLTVLCLPILSDGGAIAAGNRDLPEFSPTVPPAPTPDVTLGTRDGATVQLAEFRGRPVLLNFWATWCVPCVAEMPSLTTLAAERKGTPLAIVAVSVDRRGEGAVGPFLAQHKLETLPIYLDPKSDAAHAFGVDAIPTTILIDRDGREVGRLMGAVHWDGAAARALIDKLLAPRVPDTISTQR
ncbi:MAG TPA: TlpA disulfide reductase family protein [Stellaceae bacterium]|nr:TlpA disulfide reductase family protein [Stellaceae bacterium]